MQPFLEYIAILCATCLFVEWAEPVQFIKELLLINPESDPKALHLKIIQGLVNCCLCSGFWIGLIYYFYFSDYPYLLMGFLTSVGSELFYRLLPFIYWKLSGRK